MEDLNRTDRATGIAKAFVERGADTCFGVPGGGPNLELIGALRRAGLRFVLAHGETSACIMASAYGFVSNTVAPTVVTRGPGAASAVNGAAQATLDRFPLALITDSVASSHVERVPHQRIDQRAMFEPVTKATTVVGATSTTAEVGAMLDLALHYPQGTVHLNYDSTAPPVSFVPPEPNPRQHSADGAAELISNAMRPLVICGIDCATAGAGLGDVLERFAAPVLTTYQAIGVVDTEGEINAGLFTNGHSERALLEEADLIVAIGLDPVEPIPAPWTYQAPVLSITSHPTTDPYMPIRTELIGDILELASAMLVGEHDWPTRRAVDYRNEVRESLRDTGDGERFGANAVVRTVIDSETYPDIVTVDAGAHFLAVMPFWPVAKPKRLLISNGLATMGFAVPAAIGAALARPGARVLAFVGDGGLGMTLAELETMARLDLPITVLVLNDAALSLIEIKQSSDDGSGADAVNYTVSDFAQIARGMGVKGDIATDITSLQELLDQPWTSPRVIDARIDPGDYRHLLRVTRG